MKKWIWIVVPIVVLLSLVGLRFKANEKKEAEAQTQQSQRRRSNPAVEVATVEPAVLVDGIEAVGSAESPFRVEIAPRNTGRIETLSVREGIAVRKGDVLAVIDGADLQARVLQQEAAVAEARSRLSQAEFGTSPNDAAIQGQIQQSRANVESAQADLRQLEQTYEAQVASAEASVVEAQGRVDAARAQVKVTEAAVAREQASLANLETRLKRQESLFEKGYVPGQTVDDARTTAEVQAKQLQVASSQLEAAKSNARSLDAVLTAARNQVTIVRRRSQAEIDAGKARLTQARAGLTVADANRSQSPAYRQNLSALRASLGAAEAQLRQARALLDETVIRSPIDGTVTSRSADPGTIASSNQPILVVQSLESLFFVTALPIEQSSKVRVGQRADVQFDALPGRTFVGTISNVNPSAELQSRQFLVRVQLKNPDGAIKPGMFGKARLVAVETKAPAAVPLSAIKNRMGQDAQVMVVDAENKAVAKKVQLGPTDGTMIEIRSGLNTGDRVIVLSYQPVKDGQEVQLGKPEGGRR